MEANRDPIESFDSGDAALIAKAFRGYNSLQPIEQFYFCRLMGSHFQLPADSWRIDNVELIGLRPIDDWAWQFGTQYFPYLDICEWWVEYRSGFAPSFRNWVDSILEPSIPISDSKGDE
jgi:hypothetical protein